MASTATGPGRRAERVGQVGRADAEPGAGVPGLVEQPRADGVRQGQPPAAGSHPPANGDLEVHAEAAQVTGVALAVADAVRHAVARRRATTSGPRGEHRLDRLAHARRSAAVSAAARPATAGSSSGGDGQKATATGRHRGSRGPAGRGGSHAEQCRRCARGRLRGRVEHGDPRRRDAAGRAGRRAPEDAAPEATARRQPDGRAPPPPPRRLPPRRTPTARPTPTRPTPPPTPARRAPPADGRDRAARRGRRRRARGRHAPPRRAEAAAGDSPSPRPPSRRDARRGAGRTPSSARRRPPAVSGTRAGTPACRPPPAAAPVERPRRVGPGRRRGHRLRAHRRRRARRRLLAGRRAGRGARPLRPPLTTTWPPRWPCSRRGSRRTPATRARSRPRRRRWPTRSRPPPPSATSTVWPPGPAPWSRRPTPPRPSRGPSGPPPGPRRSPARRPWPPRPSRSRAESTSWKAAGDRLKAIVEEWKTIRGIDRKTDEALWSRFAAARDAFGRRRGAHFAAARRPAR